MSDYTNSMADGIQYLVAMGSIIGLLGLIAGFLILLMGGKRRTNAGLQLLIISFILVAVCGLDTGIKYFRIRIY